MTGSEVAQLISELRGLISDLQKTLIEERDICTKRGQLIEFDLIPSLADQSTEISNLKAEIAFGKEKIEHIEKLTDLFKVYLKSIGIEGNKQIADYFTDLQCILKTDMPVNLAS